MTNETDTDEFIEYLLPEEHGNKALLRSKLRRAHSQCYAAIQVLSRENLRMKGMPNDIQVPMYESLVDVAIESLTTILNIIEGRHV